MKEVCNDLFVGNQDDYEYNIKNNINDWYVIQACKEPYHRQALGYTGRGAPKNHSEYLIAKRGNRLILNLVDVNDPSYVAKEIIDEAISFIKDGIKSNKKVLVHCNQGMSRSPSIAMLYLAIHTDLLDKNSFEESEKIFKEIYPNYVPANGIRQFMINNWKHYVEKKKEEE